MRTIEISNEIFGKIWSASVEGDKSENDILARMFAEREFLAEVEAEPEHVETKTIQVKSHERTITIPRIGKPGWKITSSEHRSRDPKNSGGKLLRF